MAQPTHGQADRPLATKLSLGLMVLALSTPAVTAQTGHPTDPIRESRRNAPDAAPSERAVARQLARLDDRLELDTFPDGSGLWTARLAAVLEYRLDEPAASDPVGAPAPDLMRRLASRLRRLGVERGLEGSPPQSPGRTEEREPPGKERAERLRRILETVRLLHDKLDRLEEAPSHETTLQALAAPANDDCASATTITEGTFSGSTSEATADGISSCGSTTGTPDVWYRYTAPQAGSVTFDTFGSSYDTVLSIHDGCPDNGRDVELACNDDADGTVQSQINLDLASSEEVWVRVSGFGGSTGSFELNVEQTETIAGTITRQDTGESISGATVTLYNQYGYSLESVTTGTDGTYTFGGLAEGTYYVRAAADGTIPELYDDVACPFYAYCWPDIDGTPIQVGSEVTSGIDLALAPAGTISGTVTAASSGDPIEAYLELYSGTGSFLDSVYTGLDGTYEIDELPAGKYYLVAEAAEYRNELYDDVPCGSGCDVTTGTRLAVLSGATLSGTDFALDRLGAITGTLTRESTGVALQSERVEAFDSSGFYVRGVYTDSGGTYRLGSLEPGTYYVRSDTYDYRNEVYDDVPCGTSCDVTTGTPLTITLDTTTSGVDLALARLGSITGTVTHTVSGNPIAAGVEVVAYDEAGGYRRSSYTSSVGTYTLERLQPGSYTLATRSDTFLDELYDDMPCPDGCDVTTGDPVSVTVDTATPGIDFALDRLGIIEGQVTAADTGNGLAADIAVYDVSGSLVATDYGSFDGYNVPGLSPGTYYVKTQHYPYSAPAYQDELYDDVPCEPTCDFSQGTGLTVGLNGTVLGVDFVLAPCGGDTYKTIVETLYLGTQGEAACERLTAGDGTTVGSGADVTFRSGGSIVLTDGFAVESGGTFRAVIEPSWTDE